MASSTIRYKSTRGGEKGRSFEEVVLGGLAGDKGLYVPESIPHFAQKEIEAMRSMPYAELAYTVISKFVSPNDIPEKNLRDIINRSFSTFRTPEVTPSIKLNDFWVLELFHGPTFAFKDVALQFLGNLFEYFLTKENAIQNRITILGATSGDTGSAAIYGLRGKKNVNCFIMYPTGKVTDIQERQMTSILDSNIHCLSVEGDFDTCQALVKAAFADKQFSDDIKLGAINSINWARVLAQITYYFYSWLRTTAKGSTDKVNFAVPTGNFGDILAGYYAKRMGLPVGKLVICTNQNDVLHRFLISGSYKRDPCEATIAPSMDISVSSNFERYLLFLAEGSTEKLASWMNTFESTGEVTVPSSALQMAREDFLSHASNKSDILEAMKKTFDKEKYLVCPHTATAVVAVKALGLPSATTTILATAHPAKFEEAITLSLGDPKNHPPRPEQLEILFSLPTKTTLLPNSLDRVKAFMKSKIGNSSEHACRSSTPSIWKFIQSNSSTLITLAALASVLVYSASRK